MKHIGIFSIRDTTNSKDVVGGDLYIELNNQLHADCLLRDGTFVSFRVSDDNISINNIDVVREFTDNMFCIFTNQDDDGKYPSFVHMGGSNNCFD